MEEESEIRQKPKLSKERLDILAKARAKKLEKNKLLREITDKEKAIKQKEFEQRQETVNKKYQEVSRVKEVPIKEKKEK
jgi:hypothetical protein